jgi:hypothetical protein
MCRQGRVHPRHQFRASRRVPDQDRNLDQPTSTTTDAGTLGIAFRDDDSDPRQVRSSQTRRRFRVPVPGYPQPLLIAIRWSRRWSRWLRSVRPVSKWAVMTRWRLSRLMPHSPAWRGLSALGSKAGGRATATRWPPQPDGLTENVGGSSFAHDPPTWEICSTARKDRPGRRNRQSRTTSIADREGCS